MWLFWPFYNFLLGLTSPVLKFRFREIEILLRFSQRDLCSSQWVLSDLKCRFLPPYLSVDNSLTESKFQKVDGLLLLYLSRDRVWVSSFSIWKIAFIRTRNNSSSAKKSSQNSRREKAYVTLKRRIRDFGFASIIEKLNFLTLRVFSFAFSTKCNFWAMKSDVQKRHWKMKNANSTEEWKCQR